LSDRCSVRGRLWLHASRRARRRIPIHSSIHLGLRAVLANVPRLTTAVARLAGLVERSAVRCGAVPADVAELAASIALHGLGLAITREVVRSSTLVAGRSTVVASKAAAEAAAAETAASKTAASETAAAEDATEDAADDAATETPSPPVSTTKTPRTKTPSTKSKKPLTKSTKKSKSSQSTQE